MAPFKRLRIQSSELKLRDDLCWELFLAKLKLFSFFPTWVGYFEPMGMPGMQLYGGVCRLLQFFFGSTCWGAVDMKRHALP